MLALAIVLKTLYSSLKYKIIAGCNASLKKSIFEKSMGRNVQQYEAVDSGVDINDLMTNCDLIEQYYFKNTFQLWENVLQLVLAGVAICLVNPLLLAVMIVLSLLTLILSNLGNEKIESSMSAYASNKEKYSIFIKEAIRNFLLFRAYNVKDTICSKHSVSCNEMENSKFEQQKVLVIKSYGAEFFGFLSTLIIMAVAAYLVIIGRVSIGIVLASAQIIGKITYPITVFPEIIFNYKSAKPITEMLLTRETDESKGNQDITDLKSIEIKKLNFCYPNAENKILSNVNMIIHKGDKILIQGASGTGKSTLAKLIAGYYKNYDGEIDCNEIDNRLIKTENLNSKLLLLNQEPLIIEDTLRENITLFKKFSDEEIEEALDCVGFKDYKEVFADGLETKILENGSNLSGGQRQKIVLARALLHNYEWLILDEFSANIDEKTAFEIEKDLLNNNELTIINITHHTHEELNQYYNEKIFM